MDKYTLDGQLKFLARQLKPGILFMEHLCFMIPCKYSANNLYNQLSQIDNTFWGRS